MLFDRKGSLFGVLFFVVAGI